MALEKFLQLSFMRSSAACQCDRSLGGYFPHLDRRGGFHLCRLACSSRERRIHRPTSPHNAELCRRRRGGMDSVRGIFPRPARVGSKRELSPSTRCRPGPDIRSPGSGGSLVPKAEVHRTSALGLMQTLRRLTEGRLALGEPSEIQPRKPAKRRNESRAGGSPNSLAYSRLNCVGLS